MLGILRRHWPEYLIESAGLGAFMVSAGVFASLLQHPASPLHVAVPDPLLRRLLMGLAMGGTAAAIIYSPLGQRSGAHLNPAVTLTFWRLSKIEPWDAVFYVVAQLVGGLAGMGLAVAVLGGVLAHPNVNFVVTQPGSAGPWVALLAEAVIAFLLMITVLVMTNQPRLNRYTGLAVAALLAVYITFEAPLSGMSLNPARSLASAVPAAMWTSLWVYFVAPVLGMMGAVEVYRMWPGAQRVLCAKLHHDNDQRCIFRCSYPVVRGKERMREDGHSKLG